MKVHRCGTCDLKAEVNAALKAYTALSAVKSKRSAVLVATSRFIAQFANEAADATCVVTTLKIDQDLISAKQT